MEKVAIVIGATGLVGRSLVAQLVEATQITEVVTLTRRPFESASPKVRNQVVKFDQLEESATLFRGDLFFSCLGTTRKQAGSIKAQRQVDLEYQYRAAQLAARSGVRHYLMVSSSGADVNSTNDYLQMKGELEQRVRILPFERISIFQPSLLQGQRAELRWAETLANCTLPLLCCLPFLHRYRPIPAEQVAAKMIRVSQQAGNSLECFKLDEIFIE
jgi:uncharacterized protein YbjT (DUF2867 family)